MNNIQISRTFILIHKLLLLFPFSFSFQFEVIYKDNNTGVCSFNLTLKGSIIGTIEGLSFSKRLSQVAGMKGCLVSFSQLELQPPFLGQNVQKS